jgi:hypothetical protein
MADSKYCFRHNPASKKAALAASRRGGQNRDSKDAYGVRIALKTPSDATAFLEEVINAVWTGKAPAKAGATMGFLARCWLDAYDASAMDSRLKELDKRLAEAGL